MKRIPLNKGQFALVDDADFEWLMQWKWFAEWRPCTHQYRARRGYWLEGNGHHIWMHRQIMHFPVGKRIDHINGNALDNRRSNLRVCTTAENGRNRRRSCKNSSGFTGVGRHQGKWRAIITLNYKEHHLGSFLSAIDAALAYDKAALEFFGEFARTNFSRSVNNIKKKVRLV